MAKRTGFGGRRHASQKNRASIRDVTVAQRDPQSEGVSTAPGQAGRSQLN